MGGSDYSIPEDFRMCECERVHIRMHCNLLCMVVASISVMQSASQWDVRGYSRRTRVSVRGKFVNVCRTNACVILKAGGYLEGVHGS